MAMRIRYHLITLQETQSVMFKMFLEERMKVLSQYGDEGWRYVMHQEEHRNAGRERVVVVLFMQEVPEVP